MSRMIHRLYRRAYGWLDSKETRSVFQPIAAKSRGRSRLALFDLEDRVVPTTYLVTNVNDAGAGSLRQAVVDANANPGADTIVFSDGSNGSTNFNAGVNTI